MSPPDFPRRTTLPPAPPTGLETRVYMLEHHLDRIKESLDHQDLTLDDIKNTLTVIKTERGAEEKSREHRMKVITGIAVGVSVASLMSLAGWVIHLNTAMAAVGK